MQDPSLDWRDIETARHPASIRARLALVILTLLVVTVLATAAVALSADLFEEVLCSSHGARGRCY